MRRLTEITKWDDPWFMDLPVKYKLFWLYICDRCDWAGVWEPNMRLATAQIGESFELVEILRVFEKRIEQISNGKLWIKKFIQFQQGDELNPANNAHAGILKLLRGHKIQPPIPIREIQRHQSPCQGANEGLASPPSKSNSNSKSKSKEEGTGEKPKPPKSRPESEQAVIDYCTSISVPRSDGEYFWNKWIGNGFRNNHEAMRDWKGVIRSWKAAGHLPSQKPQKPLLQSPGVATWKDRKAQKDMIDEVQEKKNDLFRIKRRENREFTPIEQRKYDELAKRLEQLRAV